MVRQIKSGIMDFIGAARPSIADPFLPTKIAENRFEDIRECIGCNMCVTWRYDDVHISLYPESQLHGRMAQRLASGTQTS
jgi:dimethylamine/trimethylamine dehydrogenase